MINKNNEQLINKLDPTLLNEQISNDQFFENTKEFEASHSQNIIEKLLHLSRFGNLLTLVVGNNGSGKTQLLEELLSNLDDSSQICHINAQPLLSIDQLFQQVTEAFAGETTFNGIPLTANQYEEWAAQLTATPGNCLLIVDDAEVLSTSVLHELCQLSSMQQNKEVPHLHIILFGNYDLNSILEQASQGVLDEDGIYAIDIPSLNDTEATKWLEYLFLKAGVIFLPEQDELDDILQKGQGNLSQLKNLATEFSATSHDINEDDLADEPWRISVMGYWFAALTISIMLVLGVFFFQKELTQLIGFDDKVQTIVTEQNQNLDASVKSVIKANNIDDKVVEDVVVKDKIIEDTAVQDTIIEDTISEGTVISDRENVDSDIIDLDVIDSNQLQENESNELNNEQYQEAILAEVDSTKPEPTKPEITVENATTVSDIVTESIESESSIDTSALSRLSPDEQLLFSEPDDHYAVQLIGLSTEVTVKAFLAKHNIRNMVYYRSYLNDKPWFIITLMGYNTRAQAIKARAELTAELIKNGPWIKSIKTIKNEMSIAQSRMIE